MEAMDVLYQHSERPVSELAEVPRWIAPDIDCGTVAAILQGGCASGAYMPAVTYRSARDTMAEYGDAVFDAVEDLTSPAEIVAGLDTHSWDGWACAILSVAVEDWAHDVAEELAEKLSEEEDQAC